MSQNFFLLIFFLPFFFFGQSRKIIDKYTGEMAEFTITKLWYDNTLMDDSKVDGAIYIKLGKYYYKRVVDKHINILWFGINEKNRDITDIISKASWLSCNLNSSLFIPKTRYTYEITSSSKIYSSIISDNAEIIAPANKTRFLNIQRNKIKIEGIIFTIKNSEKAVSAPIAIEINGFNNIKINKNHFVNARITSYNNKTLHLSKNLKISNNKFDIDFSNYSSGTIQNDVLYIYDVDGLIITNNIFKVINSNRVIKISSRDDFGKITSNNILIDSNKITSNTNSKKQVIDLYQHTRNVTISNNIFNCIGHNSIIEDKTNGERDYSTNLKIVGNQFFTNGTSIRLFGNFGNMQGNESGNQNVLINNNIFTVLNQDQICINIAHYNEVNLISNKFNNSKRKYLRLAGIDNSRFKYNTFHSTIITLTDEPNVGKYTFKSIFNLLIFGGNHFDLKSYINVINASYIEKIFLENNLSTSNKSTEIENILKVKNSKILKIN